MSPSPLDLVWQAAHVESPVFTGDDVANWPPGTAGDLKRLSLLRQADTSSHVTCDACTEEHVEQVMRISYPDGQVRFFIRCPEHGRIEVDRDRLLQWSVHFDPVCRFLAGEFHIREEPEETVPARLWKIGRASLAGRSRVVWIGRGLGWPDTERFSKALPSGRLPVLFVLGGHPKAGLLNLEPDSIIEIPQVVSLSNGRLTLDRAAIENQLSSWGVKAKAKPPRKRAPRAAAIDVLQKALIQHINAARDHADAAEARGVKWKPIPRPTQKQLAAETGLSRTRVSHALRDRNAPTLKMLWETAANPDRVKEYGRR